MKIAQPAAAVFQVRFLHAGGVAIFGAPGRLVLKPGGDVFFLEADDAFADDGLLKFLE